MVHLQVTGHCSMSCPDCCCGIPLIPKDQKSFHDWEYFENAAKYFKGMRRVHLTGGEPTLHPRFVEFVPKFRELFQCESLTIESNGHGFKKFPEIFSHFDEVYCSLYTAKSFKNSPDNSEKIAFLREHFKGAAKPVIHHGEINFIPRIRRGTKMCSRGTSDNVAYADGLLYPCCVGPGLMDGHGIPLTESWREEILQVKIPCDKCWFAEP